MEGKHFKHEGETIVIATEVKADDYYKAKIKFLESEMASLNREVQALEDKEDKLNGVIEELHEAIAHLEIENEKLRTEIIRRIVG